MMAGIAETKDLLASLPKVAFAQFEMDGDQLSLSCDGRLLARVTLTDDDRPAPWSANQAINLLAHQALFTSGIDALPPAEAVNTAHQVLEWWDGVVCAISALNRGIPLNAR
ncbi:MAG: hypothetical protein LDL39_07900 [Magnetospirillum sp.]|nr:hypothetical protein [Magnetospirillum sp.]